MALTTKRCAVTAILSGACALLAIVALPGRASAGGEEPGTRDPTGGFAPCAGAAPAKVVYERTWRAARGAFGAAGMPAPRLLFVDRRAREMRVSATGQGYRRVEILAVQRLALAGMRGCREALTAKECLVHEFAHVYQAEPWSSGEIRPDQIYEEIPEGLAEAKAQAVMRGVFGLARSAYDQPAWATYDAEARQVRKQYPGLIRRGQFGANWGRDPRLIPWEEPNPFLG